jgi:hypothetical protein
MNNVSRAAARALMNRKPRSFNNTEVKVDDDGTSTLFLFGSRIAVYKPNGHLYITMAGWPTKTTITRLNAIPSVHVHQHYFRSFGWTSETWVLNSYVQSNGNDFVIEKIFVIGHP